MAMPPIAESSGQTLRWTQPRAGRRTYELRTETDIVATLSWRADSSAAAEDAHGQWTFKRAGFWHPRVTVCAAGSEGAVAVFSARWTGTGTLELPAGHRVHWSATHAWQAADGTSLVQITSRQRLTRLDGTVEIAPAAAGVADLGLLVLLGWYLVVMQAQDTLTTTAAIVPVLT
jgi:hypothetical protein